MRGTITVFLLALALASAGCNRQHQTDAQMQGPAALVQSPAGPQVRVLVRAEYAREMRLKDLPLFLGLDRRVFHAFEIHRIAATPQASYVSSSGLPVLVSGDPGPEGRLATHPHVAVVAAGPITGRIVRQDGDIVWLLIGDHVVGVDVHTGLVSKDVAAMAVAKPEAAELAATAPSPAFSGAPMPFERPFAPGPDGDSLVWESPVTSLGANLTISRIGENGDLRWRRFTGQIAAPGALTYWRLPRHLVMVGKIRHELVSLGPAPRMLTIDVEDGTVNSAQLFYNPAMVR